LFEELKQAIYQPAAAADDMKPALMLMLFQDSVDVRFQFTHSAPPAWIAADHGTS
jgi:hypothetical protein